MSRKWSRVIGMPLLAAALWFAGCADQDTGAGRLLGPDAAELARGGSVDPAQSRGQVVRAAARGGGVREWKVARGRLPETAVERAEKVIGPEGGYLYAAEHVLMVPARAVSHPTTFRIQASRKRVEGEGTVAVQVSLKAIRTGRAGREVDVGSAGFNTPVYLGLSYAWADNVSDPSQATILWLTGPGTGEEVPVRTVDYGRKWVVGELDHFSDYVMAMP